MDQVTIYLDTEIENKMKTAAQTSQLSVSKWIANIIEKKYQQNGHKMLSIWQVAGKMVFHNTKEFERVNGLNIEDWY